MATKVPVLSKRNSADSLENFAKRIEARLRAKDGSFAMERLVCRLLEGSDLKVSAVLAAKWVEWRYGKAVQPVAGPDGKEPMRVLVEHVGTANQASAEAK